MVVKALTSCEADARASRRPATYNHRAFAGALFLDRTIFFIAIGVVCEYV